MAHSRTESSGLGKYARVSTSEAILLDDSDKVNEEPFHTIDIESHSRYTQPSRWSRMPFSLLQLVALVLIGGAVFAFAGGLVTPSRKDNADAAVSTANSESVAVAPGTIVDGKCVNPSLRKEWRTLSTEQKDEYIKAVKCLAQIPSTLGKNGTLYDDFPWVHGWIGMRSHQSAGFSSWHRHFLHIYEDTLRTQCGYTGFLTYWDWTLDWMDLRKSPIWDNEHGFGSDGESAIEAGVSMGYCVTEGPFKDIRPVHHIGQDKEHCLSRGLSKDDDRVHEAGATVSPDSIERILQTPDFESFVPTLEKTTHDAIHNVVRGDFMEATAPNDPLFYVHHVQLDRMWWLWQQRDLENRLVEYTGNNSAQSGIPASLDDALPMAGLGPDGVVRDIMNTEGSHLCYRY